MLGIFTCGDEFPDFTCAKKNHYVLLFLRKTQHWIACPSLTDYTVALSPKRARKNTRAHALSRLLNNLCGSQVVSM
jgi:hypothetical protein